MLCIQKFKEHFAREIEEVVCVCTPTEHVHVCVEARPLKLNVAQS